MLLGGLGTPACQGGQPLCPHTSLPARRPSVGRDGTPFLGSGTRSQTGLGLQVTEQPPSLCSDETLTGPFVAQTQKPQLGGLLSGRPRPTQEGWLSHSQEAAPRSLCAVPGLRHGVNTVRPSPRDSTAVLRAAGVAPRGPAAPAQSMAYLLSHQPGRCACPAEPCLHSHQNRNARSSVLVEGRKLAARTEDVCSWERVPASPGETLVAPLRPAGSTGGFSSKLYQECVTSH